MAVKSGIILSFEEFAAGIEGLLKKVSSHEPVEYDYDEEKRLYTAKTCGYRFSGRPGSRSVTTVNGTHCFMFTI